MREREAKRRKVVESGHADSGIIGEYDFSAKAGPYMERESWLLGQEEKGRSCLFVLASKDVDSSPSGALN